MQHHPYVLIKLANMRFDANEVTGGVARELREHTQARASKHAVEDAEDIAASKARFRRARQGLQPSRRRMIATPLVVSHERKLVPLASFDRYLVT